MRTLLAIGMILVLLIGCAHTPKQVTYYDAPAMPDESEEELAQKRLEEQRAETWKFLNYVYEGIAVTLVLAGVVFLISQGCVPMW